MTYQKLYLVVLLMLLLLVMYRFQRTVAAAVK